MQLLIQTMFDQGNFEEAIEVFKLFNHHHRDMENPIIIQILWRKLLDMLEKD